MISRILHQLTELLGAPPGEEYLQLIRNYPERLKSAQRAIDDSDEEGVVADAELLMDLESVLEINQEARSDSFPDPEGQEFVWPQQFMVIGETGSGDYYCMDVRGEVEGVMQYNHQAVEFELIADSLQEFVEILYETFCDEDTSHL
ncbi:MAG: SMI1/KNR4 family protein [Fuerstiella sp.]